MKLNLGGHQRSRAILGPVAAVCALALLAGCGSGTSTPSVSSSATATVNFWGWVPGLESLVANYNALHTGTTVVFHRMTGDDGTKVKAAVDAGAGPDVVQLSTHDLPDYVIAGRVVDISKYVGDQAAQYTASSWASVSFNKKVYGIPNGIGPGGLMYRTDILSKYGIAVPTTWDQYLTAARKLHAANPKVYIANMSPSEFGQWSQEIQQAGSSWYGISGNSWTVGINDAGSKLVAKRWQTLLDEKLVTTDTMWTPEYWADVNSGKIATISYAVRFPPLLESNTKATSGRWHVAALPVNAGSTNSGDSGGAADVVLKGAKNPGAAAKFISWLNGSVAAQKTMITTGGIFPSSKNGLASPALLAPVSFFNGQVINTVFKQSAANTPSTWVDGPNFGTAQSAITDQFAKVINGQETFLQALDNAQAITVKNLKARGLSVKG